MVQPPGAVAAMFVQTGDIVYRCAGTSFTHTLGRILVSKVDLVKLLLAIVDIPDPILERWTKADRLVGDAIGDVHSSSLESHIPLVVGAADLIVRAVLDRRKAFGERPGAGLISTGRCGHTQGFMGPF